MSSKFQMNNNCYAYSCNIASNSFPQPGRMHGYRLPPGFAGDDVVRGATLDGLKVAGETLEEARKFLDEPGHLVALLISPANSDLGWSGDYHWVRCDDNESLASWSQKDGGDQVTNFDFAGNPITNPARANWTVNLWLSDEDNPRDLLISYSFLTYMFVPKEGVNII